MIYLRYRRFLSEFRAAAKKVKTAKSHGLAHREGRTRSLQIVVMVRPRTRHKSLTLYPIELGGRLGMYQIMVT